MAADSFQRIIIRCRRCMTSSFTKLAAVLSFLTAATTAWSAGLPQLDGRLSTGSKFSIDVESDPPILTINRLVRKADKTVGVEGCQFSQVGENYTFACPAGTKSPFAGMTYKSRPGPGTCEKPQYYYRCVKGCGSGSIAPKILTQVWWECD
jgi:hypothetical protein